MKDYTKISVASIALENMFGFDQDDLTLVDENSEDFNNIDKLEIEDQNLRNKIVISYGTEYQSMKFSFDDQDHSNLYAIFLKDSGKYEEPFALVNQYYLDGIDKVGHLTYLMGGDEPFTEVK